MVLGKMGKIGSVFYAGYEFTDGSGQIEFPKALIITGVRIVSESPISGVDLDHVVEDTCVPLARGLHIGPTGVELRFPIQERMDAGNKLRVTAKDKTTAIFITLECLGGSYGI